MLWETLLPLANAIACFMISRSMPPLGIVRAATPLFSPWLEGEGSVGLPRKARMWKMLQPPEQVSLSADVRAAGSSAWVQGGRREGGKEGGREWREER